MFLSGFVPSYKQKFWISSLLLLIPTIKKGLLKEISMICFKWKNLENKVLNFLKYSIWNPITKSCNKYMKY